METNNQDNTSSGAQPVEELRDVKCSEAIYWWAMLVVAVIAIPAGGIIIATILPFGGLAQLITFIVGCWLCTWAGMWLMQHSNKFDKK